MISSFAEIILGSNVVRQDISDDISNATTLAYPESLEGAEPETVPPWIVVSGFLTFITSFFKSLLSNLNFFFGRSSPPARAYFFFC